MKLNLVIAESALELVPAEIRSLPSVTSDARRRGIPAESILLDRSIHHAAMLKLKDAEKRGRPDLVHITLLSITATPLYQEGAVKVYIHTYGNMILELREGTRPPKNYFRFRSLVEKHLTEKSSSDLISVHPGTPAELIKRVGADSTIGLSTQGRFTSFENLAPDLVVKRNPSILIGGFAHGHFNTSTLKILNELVRVHEKPLDAHVVAARLVYAIERRLEEDYQQ